MPLVARSSRGAAARSFSVNRSRMLGSMNRLITMSAKLLITRVFAWGGGSYSIRWGVSTNVLSIQQLRGVTKHTSAGRYLRTRLTKATRRRNLSGEKRPFGDACSTAGRRGGKGGSFYVSTPPLHQQTNNNTTSRP